LVLKILVCAHGVKRGAKWHSSLWDSRVLKNLGFDCLRGEPDPTSQPYNEVLWMLGTAGRMRRPRAEMTLT
jgi:hypothetical protein